MDYTDWSWNGEGPSQLVAHTSRYMGKDID